MTLSLPARRPGVEVDRGGPHSRRLPRWVLGALGIVSPSGQASRLKKFRPTRNPALSSEAPWRFGPGQRKAKTHELSDPTLSVTAGA